MSVSEWESTAATAAGPSKLREDVRQVSGVHTARPT